jgi:vacuolar-type H+-ATPase subunit D/Vma8
MAGKSQSRKRAPMSQPLLNASIEAEPVEENEIFGRIDSLEKEVSELREELSRNMKQVSDLLRSARITFGNSSQSTAASPQPVESDKWEKLKVKLGGKMSEVIEVLQISGNVTITQLRNQTGGALSTVKAAVYKLRDMGLLVKNGDGWSLKP